MQGLVSQQRQFFDSQATKNIKFRLQQLSTLETAIRANETLLCDAVYNDFKKSAFDTIVTELELIYQDIREAKRKLRNWARVKRVSTNLVNFPAKSFVIPEPLGVCLVIGAWNYPYQISLAPVVAAIAAGNTIVLKPSELAFNSSAAMAKIIEENFRPEYFTVVEGGVQETTALLTQKFDKIFFTGSTRVGKIIYKAAADQLTPVTLELGGKSPAFVVEDCNLKMTVKRLIWGKFLNAGQTCNSPDYVLVHRSIESKFLEMAQAEIVKEKYAVQNGNFVQIINDDNLTRLQSLLIPEKIYFGGKIDREQRILEPTILSGVSFNDAVMKEEIFGPILPVISYDNLEQAISEVKKLEAPLACYIYTRNRKTKRKVLNEIPFGGGAVNESVTQIVNPSLPFGGVGNSGMGKYHGEAGFSAFSNYKGILDKPNWLELPLRYFPHTAGKLKWIRLLFKF